MNKVKLYKRDPNHPDGENIIDVDYLPITTKYRNLFFTRAKRTISRSDGLYEVKVIKIEKKEKKINSWIKFDNDDYIIVYKMNDEYWYVIHRLTNESYLQLDYRQSFFQAYLVDGDEGLQQILDDFNSNMLGVEATNESKSEYLYKEVNSVEYDKFISNHTLIDCTNDDLIFINDKFIDSPFFKVDNTWEGLEFSLYNNDENYIFNDLCNCIVMIQKYTDDYYTIVITDSNSSWGNLENGEEKYFIIDTKDGFEQFFKIIEEMCNQCTSYSKALKNWRNPTNESYQLKYLKVFESITCSDFEEGRTYIVYRGEVPYYNRYGNRSTGFYLRERPFKVIDIDRYLIIIQYNGETWSIKPEDLRNCQFRKY